MDPRNVDNHRILSRENTAFEYTRWDCYDFLGLCSYSPTVDELDSESIRRFGRSLLFDCFLALRGISTRDADPWSRVWADVVSSSSYQALRSEFLASIRGQALATVALYKQLLEAMSRSWSREFEKNLVTGELFLEAGVPVAGAEELGAAVDAALEETTTLSAFVQTADQGGNLDGGPSEKFEQALELSTHVNLSAFARLLGWAKRLVSGATRENRGGNDEFTSYRVGELTDRTITSELLGLASGQLDSMAKLADGSLTSREFRGSSPRGKGPLILLRDESGSMGNHNSETRHKAALSLEVALAEVFNREGRDLVSIRWGSSAVAPYTYGERGLKEHLTSFLNHGSTNVIPALESAVKVADEYVDGADILILTDAGLSDHSGVERQIGDQLNRFRRSGGRIWVAVIGSSTSESQRERYLSSWVDGYAEINQIEDCEKLGKLIEGAARRESKGKTRL